MNGAMIRSAEFVPANQFHGRLMIAFAPQRPRLLLAGAALALACMLGSAPDGLAKEKASHSKTDKAASKKG